jgi:putative transcription factor
MMPTFCELCGRKLTEEKRSTIVDGLVLSVCKACSKHGKPYSSPSSVPSVGSSSNKGATPRPNPFKNPTRAKGSIQISDNIVLSPDFARLIREARTKKGLTHEQLGAQMNEKANLLKKFETGALKPDEIIARKLGRYLGIQLYVNIQEG